MMPPGLETILRISLAVMVLAVLGLISYRDAKTSEIPDALNLSLLVLGLVAMVVQAEPGWLSRLIGSVAVSGPLLLLVMARPGSLGGGDVKLMAAAGLLLGWQNVLLAASIGILLAGAYALWLMTAKQASPKDRFPFGPALCAGIAVAFLFGPAIISWLFP